jgi:hypothetical protein
MTPFVWMFISSYEKLRGEIIAKHFINNLIQLEYSGFDGATVPICTFTLRKKYLENAEGSYIRLSDFKGSQNQAPKTLEAIRNHTCGWFYNISQKYFEKIPGFALGYWLPKGMIDEFSKSPKLNTLSSPRSGLSTSDSPRFLRIWHETNKDKSGLEFDNYKNAVKSSKKWFPMMKGGGYRKWYGNHEYVVNYFEDGKEVKNWLVNNPNDLTTKSWSRYVRSPKFYFEKGLTWSGISSSKPSMRIMKNSIFGSGGKGLFGENVDFILGFLNSKISLEYLKVFSPTLNFEVGHINNLPLALRKSETVELIVDKCINLSLIEWDKNETSWNFHQNELIRIQGQDLEEAYDSYCRYWQNKFFELHKNEEELNRQFIAIYGLQDELTPDVPLEDITILKEETTIKKGALVFRESEIMAQFISYAVGCMFGRYSLDKPGLILANQGESLEDYVKKVYDAEKPPSGVWGIDDDNVIPILDNEWFEDDIVNRFYAFLKATFGKPNFDKNLAFVEDAVGDIRKYFLKTFYTDHVKRYKKRPIYWLFSSPSGAFNALIYMHRYTPDTLNTMLNGYLKEYQEKLKAQDTQLAHVKNIGTDREKINAEKKQARISKVLIELQEYDRELFKIATERIAIDLDDGVLVNYNKFGNVIKSVSGLNDKKAKDKVKKFDWIDVTEIR